MSYDVQIVADSVGPNGARLTTFALRYPMKIHWDLMTHRVFSRNASSGRVISVSRMVSWVKKDPFVPPVWTTDDTQMKQGEPLSPEKAAEATRIWSHAANQMIESAEKLAALGVHRQDANGLLVPFGYINVCVTATNFDNFFSLRCHPAARREIQVLAVRMARAYRDSTPAELKAGWWHLPFATTEELEYLCKLRGQGHYPTIREYEDEMLAACTARCARVSYKTFGGKEPDHANDVALHDRLRDAGHWSPFEHCAEAQHKPGRLRSGNFVGWTQYRRRFHGEHRESFDFSTLDQFGDRDFIV